MAEKTALDAMNEALGTSDDDDTQTTVETEGADDSAADEAHADALEDQALEHTDAEPAEPEDQEAGEDDERGADGERIRNADGTFRKKGERDPAEAEGKKKPDAVNDPIPTNVSQATQERIRSLVKIAKESETKYTGLETRHNNLVNYLSSTGAAPEQMNEIMNWTKLFYSKTAGDMEKAYDQLDAFMTKFALMLGKTRTAEDPLSGHEDLIRDVAANKLTKDYAIQIATTRNSQKLRGEIESGNRQQADASAAATKELNDMKAEFNTLETELRRTDKDYQRKHDLVMASLKEALLQLRPNQRVAAFKKAYAAVKLPPVQAARTVVPTNQPLRARTPAGNSTRAPASGLDAMNAALAELGGQ